MARVMTSIPGDDASPVRMENATHRTRLANWPLVAGAIAVLVVNLAQRFWPGKAHA